MSSRVHFLFWKKRVWMKNSFFNDMFITYLPPIKHEAPQLIKQTQTF